MKDRVLEIVGLESRSGLILGDFAISDARNHEYIGSSVIDRAGISTVSDDSSFCGNKEMSRAIDVGKG